MRNLILLALCCLATGCQCCSCTEHYCDYIDEIAYPTCHGERCYHPKLDLTRINMPDGVHCCPQGSCCHCGKCCR